MSRFGVAKALVLLARQGAPLAVAAALEVGVFQLSGVVVMAGGINELAAHQTLLTIAGFAAAIPIAVAAATSIQVAEVAAGGGAARAAHRNAALMTIVLALFLGGATLAGGEGVMASFLVAGSASWSHAVRLIPLLAALLMADTILGGITGCLRGLGDTGFIGKAALLCFGLGAALLGVLFIRRGSLDTVWGALVGAMLPLVLAGGGRLAWWTRRSAT